MGATWARNRLLYRAVVISLALHLVIALFFPALATFQGDGPSIETISFVRIMHVSVAKARPVAQERPAVAPVQAPVPQVVPRPRTDGFRSVRPSHVTKLQVSRAPITGTESRKGSTVAKIEASASPAISASPEAAEVASSQTREDTGGYMPLGVNESTPVLDPAIRKSLDALGTHTTLTIVVDAEGKTKTIAFQPPVDANVEAQIRNLLATARWDPAICGAGIACEGKTTIRL